MEEESRFFDRISDTLLVEEAQNGSLSAENELYRRYSQRLIGLTKRKWPEVLKRSLDPEDVVQSAMNNFFHGMRRGLYKIDDSTELWALLMVITLNKLRSKQAWYMAAKRDFRRTESHEMHLQTVSAETSPQEAEIYLQEILDRLPPEHRKIVELRLHGHDVAAVAAELGRSKRTVERLLNDCRVRLSKMLQESQHDLP
ncbi:MAG: sigma-70 family RNA polymerase sigma factor [Gemmataceae bacterium]|nr:sigma-70 family RNA polymerase sigma factor [Gemmataceae bacterium]